MSNNITKITKDFFSTIIGKEVELSEKTKFNDYDILLIDQIFRKSDIVVKSVRLPNYRFAYFVYIPDDDERPYWSEIEVHDEATIHNESTGESTTAWQIEKLRYSEIMAIKHQLEQHKKEKFVLSDSENYYVLGPAKKLDDLTAKIAYGL